MPSRVTDVLERTARSRGDNPALKVKRDGRWQTTTWNEYRDRVHLVARALMALGFEPGDHTTIVGYNSPEWFIADVGTIAAGGIPAGIYTTNTPEQCQYIAEHCDARVAFVDSAEQVAKFRAIRDQLPALRAIVLMRGEADGSDVISWREFLAMGNSVPDDELRTRIERQHENDVATLIYTSGTTGVPKAVMLTHRNLTWEVEKGNELLDLRPGDDMLSYLPLSHIAEQLFSLHGPMSFGGCIWFAESIDTLGDNLAEVRPHHFLGVPRVWEKIQSKIEAAGAQSSPTKKRVARWARGIGLTSGYATQRGGQRATLYPIADKLVFSKVRNKLGFDRARTLVTGAAPISPRTLEFFLSLGLPICDAYGMSECTGATTMSTPTHYRTGKAGRCLPGAEVKVAEDGEICIRGPHVFKGYHKDPAATAEMIDDDGWLHSGDVGTLDADGFLQITDRKKELIITAGGENVAPQLVEGQLKSIGVVNQAVVVGDRRRYLSVLLTLDPQKIPPIASLAGSPARDPETAAQCERFAAYLQREIDAVNQRLARVQTVKRFAILPHELTVEGGELTPTMKLKRKVIHEKYAAEIEKLYQ